MDYFEFPEMPGVKVFRCRRLLSSLSVHSCAQNWRRANLENVERLSRCKTCVIGAEHAGEVDPSMSPLLGTPVCARCQNASTRLIGKHLCVSCYNRQREWMKGRNSKGTAPVRMKPLARRSLRYMLAGQPRMLTMDHSADILELVVAVLRDSKKRVQFAFNGLPQGIAQSRLF